MEPVLLDSDASLEPGPSAPLDTIEHAIRCGDIWAAALKIYFNDAKSAWKGHKQADCESLDDLLGDQRVLANLCRPLDIDHHVIAAAMLANARPVTMFTGTSMSGEQKHSRQR